MKGKQNTILLINCSLRTSIFSDIRNKFDTPEDINDSPDTAPSKRIRKIVGSYDKVAEGLLIAADIGLQKLRNECPHFNAWITELENLE